MGAQTSTQKFSRTKKLRLKERLRIAAKTNSGRIHVVPYNGKWIVKKEGNKDGKQFATKQLAIENAKTYNTTIYIHDSSASVVATITKV